VIGWVGAAWLLLAGSTVLLFLGLPVAFSFLAINLVGAWLWLGGEPGLAQLARNSVSSVMSFSLIRTCPSRPTAPWRATAGSSASLGTLPRRTTIAPRRSSSLVDVAKTGRPSRRNSLVSWSGRSITSTPVRRHMLRKVRRSGASNRARFPSRTFSILGRPVAF